METTLHRGEFDEIYRIVRADGELRWIHDRGYPIRNACGEIYRMVGTAEVPVREVCVRLAALARSSGNRVVAIGYDCIPVVSADLSPATATTRTAHYLSMVKHAKRVGAISSSAFAEFSGFVEMLPAQGLSGQAADEPTNQRNCKRNHHRTDEYAGSMLRNKCSNLVRRERCVRRR